MMTARTRRRLEVAVVVALFAGGFGLRLTIDRNNFVFAGSDSYGYIKLADEWRVHGRYALAPAPAPLHFGRMPLYAAFIAVVKGDERAAMSGGDGWGRITRAQALLDIFVTGMLAWLMARRLGGPVAGVITLLLVMFAPFTVMQQEAALTECLATALTMLAVAPLVLLRERPWRALAVSGAAVALATLTRPDGMLAALAWLPALWRLPTRRQRAIGAAIVVGAAAVVFAPWPLRNLYQFGQPWTLGSRVDRFGNPILHWRGPHHYLQSFGRDWQTHVSGTWCALDRGCPMADWKHWGAIETDEDEAALLALMRRQAHEGLTPAVSATYEELASARVRRHPLAATVGLPALRAAQMWTTAFDELLQKPPPLGLFFAVRPALAAINVTLAIALIVAAVLMLLDRSLRGDAAVLLTAIGGRTFVLAYTFYCMPRYIREVQPLAYVVIGCGAVLAARRLSLIRQRSTT
jgi:hypothetical protein